MDAPEQTKWLAEHIPHRVRAAIARLPMENSILRVTATIDLQCRTEQDRIYWRCAADSIWEGRLAATRWLIEFVGIKQGKGGNPVRCEKDPKYPDDVHIQDFDGGVPLNHQTLAAADLASVWKRDVRRRRATLTSEYSHLVLTCATGEQPCQCARNRVGAHAEHHLPKGGEEPPELCA